MSSDEVETGSPFLMLVLRLEGVGQEQGEEEGDSKKNRRVATPRRERTRVGTEITTPFGGSSAIQQILDFVDTFASLRCQTMSIYK